MDSVVFLNLQLPDKIGDELTGARRALASPSAVELERCAQRNAHIRAACQVACKRAKVGRGCVGVCLRGLKQARPGQDEGTRMAAGKLVGAFGRHGDAARGMFGEGARHGLGFG